MNSTGLGINRGPDNGGRLVVGPAPGNGLQTFANIHLHGQRLGPAHAPRGRLWEHGPAAHRGAPRTS
eukprot:11158630-Lingulodinium_polyedra.AAC.1